MGVISNHETLRPVADHFGLPFHHVPVDKDNKAAAEAAQIGLLKSLGVDLVVLARYMQILSPNFVSNFPRRIINIHHSFLPAFIGARPYHQAKARGVKLIGATAHYVTDDLDEGPIIEQDTCRVTHKHEVDELVQGQRDGASGSDPGCTPPPRTPDSGVGQPDHRFWISGGALPLPVLQRLSEPADNHLRWPTVLLLFGSATLFAVMALGTRLLAMWPQVFGPVPGQPGHVSGAISGAQVALVRFAAGVLMCLVALGAGRVRLYVRSWRWLHIRGWAGGMAVLLYFFLHRVCWGWGGVFAEFYSAGLGVGFLLVAFERAPPTGVLCGLGPNVFRCSFGGLAAADGCRPVEHPGRCPVCHVKPGSGKHVFGRLGVRFGFRGLGGAGGDVYPGDASPPGRGAARGRLDCIFSVQFGRDGDHRRGGVVSLGHWVAPTGAQWAVLGGVALASAVAQLIMTSALRVVPAPTSGLIHTLTPVLSLLGGVWFFDEHLHPAAWTGVALTFGGVLLTIWAGASWPRRGLNGRHRGGRCGCNLGCSRQGIGRQPATFGLARQRLFQRRWGRFVQGALHFPFRQRVEKLFTQRQDLVGRLDPESLVPEMAAAEETLGVPGHRFPNLVQAHFLGGKLYAQFGVVPPGLASVLDGHGTWGLLSGLDGP